ncbi:MAG TPA: glycosyltransferase family 2 protein [Solirubrobacteraceae bacterium]|nr:glycosyltransferase family 2 protein [Solirubrobacteraceae bacterium]
MKRVTAAVLNYNGRDLLGVILPSLERQTYRDFEVMVVDNGSSDNSVRYLRAHWPQIRVVSLGAENIGVAAALNVAVRKAKGELIALLNNDIELEPGWLAELVTAVDRHPDAATVAGKLLNFYRREVIDAAGDIFTHSATAFGRGGGERDVGQYGREEEVFAPTAGAALYRASALADVGSFDESFFAYFEDVDWGLRAQLLGHRSWYVPSAVGYHMGSETTRPTVNTRYYELQHRNTLALLVKDVPLPFMLRNAHHIVAHHVLALAYSARAGLLAPHLRGFACALRASPGWLRERRRIQRTRRVGPTEFDRFVTSRRRAGGARGVGDG